MTSHVAHTASTPASVSRLNAVVLSAIAAAAMATPLAQAQQGVPTPDGAIKLADGVSLFPTVKLSVGHDDNVRAANTGATSSTVTVLAPALRLETKNKSGAYALSYNGTYTNYNSLSTDNTTNHNLGATGAHEFSARSRLSWSAGFQDSVDPRADAVVASAEPDQWRGQNLSAVYSYGAPQAQGRIETGFSAGNKRYQNNPETTKNSDVNTQEVSGRFFWRVMPRTYLVAEVRLGKADYLVGTANNNTDTRLLAGVTWEATAKTTGQFKLGRQQKSFDNASKPDTSGGTYEASVEWKPLTYSTFTLVANRSAADALVEGAAFIQNSSLGLTWAHQWSSAVSTRVGLNNAKADYVNLGRNDDTLTTNAGVSYSLGRRFVLGLDLVHTERDSTVTTNAFKRNSVLVSISAAL
jgi:hypothetical protein